MSPRQREQQVQMCGGVMASQRTPRASRGSDSIQGKPVIREMDGTDQAAVMELPEAARPTLSRQGCLLKCAFGEGALSLSQEPW